TQAASKLVSQSVGTGVLEQNTDEMPHIESVRSRATGKAPEEVSVFSPILETTGVLQDKIAKGIRDVFSGGPREEQPETETEETADSAAEDTEDYSIQDDTKDYVVKDLEPDNPASLGSVTPAAKESPVSRTVEAPKPKAVKAQEPVREVDLDAILAETAGELAQAVAKVSEGVAPAGAAVADTHSFTAQNADVTPVTEAEKAEEAASQIEAAVSEKAEEPVYQTEAAAPEKVEEPAYGVEAAESEKAEEPVYQTEAAELKKTEEPAYQTEVQEPEKTEETAYQTEAAESEKTEETAYQTEAAESEKAEETAYQTEAAESERIEEPAYRAEADTQEETVFAEEEIPGQPSMADIMAEAAVTSEADIPDGRTIEIPVEEVRAGLGGMTIDLQKALESAVMEPESPAQTEDTVQSGNVVQSDAMMQSGASVQPEDSENEFIHTVAEDKRMPAEASMSPAGIATESILRHHLTPEEQKRLFTYFAPIPGLTQQITEALDIAQESACAKTSKSGNIVITGREGAGKTRLSEGLIKAICKERHMEGAKIAYLDAQKMNEKDPAYVVDKLAGGFLVVENASSLQSDVIEKLSKAMEFRTNRLTVILEDLKPGIQNLEKMYPEFMEKFDSRVVIPVFTNDELVSFAKTYSKEMGYKIDDMAVLALYTLIGDNQDEDDPVSVGQVKEMMDSAIKRASRGGRRPGKKVAKRHLDESGRIMLYEKDFDV
ncbi:MAG: hypothetical protein ACLRNP_09515, partial [Blautia coccoides]